MVVEHSPGILIVLATWAIQVICVSKVRELSNRDGIVGSRKVWKDWGEGASKSVL